MTGANESSGPMPEMVLPPAPSTSVFCTLRFEATHDWPGAEGITAFLGSSHRHMFHIRATVPVQHDDRDVEFIRMKGEIRELLDQRFGREGSLPDMGATSCEMLGRYIALYLLAIYGAAAWAEVEVSEDGENGATVLEVRG